MNITSHTPEQSPNIESSMSNFRRAMTGAGVGAALLLTACSTDSKDYDVTTASVVDAGVVPTTDLAAPITVEVTTTTEQPISAEDQEIIDKVEAVSGLYAGLIVDGYFAAEDGQDSGNGGNNLESSIFSSENNGRDSRYAHNSIDFDPISGQLSLQAYVSSGSSTEVSLADPAYDNTTYYNLEFSTGLPADTLIKNLSPEEIKQAISDGELVSGSIGEIATIFDNNTAEVGDKTYDNTDYIFVHNDINGLHVSMVTKSINPESEYDSGDMKEGGAGIFVDRLAVASTKVSEITQAALLAK